VDVFAGKFDFYRIAEANPLWGPAILLSYSLFVALVLINFFVTIIIDSYEEVGFEHGTPSIKYWRWRESHPSIEPLTLC
jgi:hypothetical protein